MSDERFDQDLRSVLLEDAPRDVPDDLRRRVAAIPATTPVATHSPRLAWWVPAALRLAGMAALVAVLAVGFWRFGPASQPGVGGQPSTTPAAPEASAGPVASASASASSIAAPSERPHPSPSTTVGACQAADLAGRIVGWQGAAGSRIADVEVTNRATRPCVVQGTPGLELVDAGGRVMIDSATSGPSGQPHVTSTDPRFEIASGGQLRTQVETTNYCGAAPSLPIDIAFTLPSGGGRFEAKPGPGVSSAEATPPCLGSTGSVIVMNGWRR